MVITENAGVIPKTDAGKFFNITYMIVSALDFIFYWNNSTTFSGIAAKQKN